MRAWRLALCEVLVFCRRSSCGTLHFFVPSFNKKIPRCNTTSIITMFKGTPPFPTLKFHERQNSRLVLCIDSAELSCSATEVHHWTLGLEPSSTPFFNYAAKFCRRLFPFLFPNRKYGSWLECSKVFSLLYKFSARLPFCGLITHGEAKIGFEFLRHNLINAMESKLPVA